MRRAIWILSWPILIESFLNSLVGLTDTVLAAGLSESATDAIGGASYVMWFIGLVIMSIGVGATALISRSVGGGRIAVANAAVGQTMLLGITIGALVGLLIALAAHPVAGLLNMNDEATRAFTIYLRTIAAGIPFTAILFGSIACARGAGDSIRPLAAMGVVNVVNIVLSFALSGVDLTTARVEDGITRTSTILANPFSFDLGISGIAVGTLAAHAVGAAIMLWLLVRGSCGIRLRRHRLRPHWHTARRLIRVGLPNFFETFGLWIGNFIVLLMVGWLGASGLLGAHIVAIRIEAFSFMPGFAMGMAAATLAGQYLGAGSPALARRAVLWCTGIAVVVMGTLGAAFVLFPDEIVGLFTSQPTHLRIAPHLVRICGYVQIPFAVAIVTRSALRGAGDVRVVMTLTWITTYLIRLPLAYVLSGVDITSSSSNARDGLRVLLENPSPFHGGLEWLWLGLCLELVVRGGVFAARFAQGGWTRIRV